MTEPTRSRYLTFVLGAERHAIALPLVKEIRVFDQLTPVPNVPAYIPGLMNLRGSLVPVVDLRTRLGLPCPQYDKQTVIVVLLLGKKRVGVIVDTVLEVLPVPADGVLPAPDLGAHTARSFLRASLRCDDTTYLVLDVEALLSTELHADSEPVHA